MSRPLHSWEKIPDTRWAGGSRSPSESVGEKKNLMFLPGFEPCIVLPQRRHYSNYAIPTCISDLDLLTILRTLVTVKRTITVLALGSAFEQFCCRKDEREPLLVKRCC
jgi:hypothetical protein